MEVPGQKQAQRSERSKGSSEDSLILCQPCSADGDQTEAEGFCQNCEEFLCRACVKYHRKTTLTKHHAILDKEHMPKEMVSQKPKQLCTESCEKHTLEVIKFFCRDHDTVGCSNCMVIDHKACKVDFIPDIAEEFVNGKEYKTLLKKFEEIQVNVKSMKDEIENCTKMTTESYKEAVEEIRKFRKEMDRYLDKMEREMMKECERLKAENKETLKKVEVDIDAFQSEIEMIQGRLMSHSKETTDLFIQVKQISSRFDRLENDQKQASNTRLSKYDFQRNKDLEASMTRSNQLGKLICQTIQIKSPYRRRIVDFEPTLAGEINVKSPSDKSDIFITSMVAVLPDTLLCVDNNNRSVKVVDTDKSRMCFHINLESSPWDITVISSDQVAVTLPNNKKILCLLFKNQQLSRGRAIKVNGKCQGISYHQNTFVVSFCDTEKLEILTLDGKVIRTFVASPDNKYELGWPGCVDMAADKNSFFLSDSSLNCVYKISLNGDLLSTYRDNELCGPRGVTVCTDGSVLLCSIDNCKVHLLSSDCRKIKTLLTEENRQKHPMAVYYNDRTSTLYLSKSTNPYALSDSSKVIEVYKRKTTL